MDGVKHMLDMCQLTNRDTDRKYSGSHEQITKVIKAKFLAQFGQRLDMLFQRKRCE